jgi:subtilisin family serine protease
MNTPFHLTTKEYFSVLSKAGYQVEYNYEASILGFKDGPNTLGTSTWDDEDMKADQVWSVYNKTGSTNEKVVVMDTGVDYDHADLDSNVAASIRNHSTAVIWDKVENDNDPQDENGHGTHVAGITHNQRK